MSDHAKIFRQLHHQVEPLILANAWDAGSARLIESLGAKAIATTSAGVGWALGYPDGDVLPVARLAELAAAIVRLIGVPLTVDCEAGYSEDPAQVADNIIMVLDAGAVGINIEDGASPPALLAAKIEKIKAAAAVRGIDVFVNARTDVYLKGLVAEERRVAETLRRAETYKSAGADGLFVPGLIAPDGIAAVAAAAGLPLNLLAWPGLAPAADLAALGVRRLSAGSGVAQKLWYQAASLARAFLASGRSEPFAEHAMAFSDLQHLFVHR